MIKSQKKRSYSFTCLSLCSGIRKGRELVYTYYILQISVQERQKSFIPMMEDIPNKEENNNISLKRRRSIKKQEIITATLQKKQFETMFTLKKNQMKSIKIRSSPPSSSYHGVQRSNGKKCIFNNYYFRYDIDFFWSIFQHHISNRLANKIIINN